MTKGMAKMSCHDCELGEEKKATTAVDLAASAR
jgi:hypothetical protein